NENLTDLLGKSLVTGRTAAWPPSAQSLHCRNGRHKRFCTGCPGQPDDPGIVARLAERLAAPQQACHDRSRPIAATAPFSPRKSRNKACQNGAKATNASSLDWVFLQSVPFTRERS